MRPRHKAAENQVVVALEAAAAKASMRPRHKAAENAALAKAALRNAGGFNEAAA